MITEADLRHGFKVGDVVRYKREGIWRIGIVHLPPQIYANEPKSDNVVFRNIWANWRYEDDEWDTHLTHTDSAVELHPDPDPDPFFVSWAAWRLTHG